jgi:hypothetical protein
MARLARDDEKRRTTMAVVDSKERVLCAVIFVQLKLRSMGVFHA